MFEVGAWPSSVFDIRVLIEVFMPFSLELVWYVTLLIISELAL